MRIAAGSVCRQRGRRWHRCRYRPRCRHARGAVQARADSRPGARPSDSSGRRDARRRVHRASPAIHAPASASRLYANCSKANPARSRADASIASASPVRACHSGCRAHGRAAGCGVVGRLVRARLPAVFIRRNLWFAKWLTAHTRQKTRVPENTGLRADLVANQGTSGLFGISLINQQLAILAGGFANEEVTHLVSHVRPPNSKYGSQMGLHQSSTGRRRP
ncbi:Uncharacterised protein [Burkholderia pseudomallei]|nr:Uncharacterised protein [Burkholderia pseudomallei]CAJ9913936.1 Uncharacterised protein [Burkholderia pseudomallei]VCA67297.1 Uncharacterised protein [Burkholderia pseudomallei]VCA80141.1 Uncharacterised protein [Burkholderia pseudomallei]VCA82515.1 Uncharacterised protein [Burkholderia pseudomallei]